MSEYQYYEFQAIDRPLDERAMSALRAITSRATITPTSLVNVYHLLRRFRKDQTRRQIRTAIQTKPPKQYDHAVELLKDLRDLAERTGTGKDVSQRIRDLRERHRGKPSLMQRLDQAGLPK